MARHLSNKLRKEKKQEREAQRKLAIVIPAGIIPSQWNLIEREFMLRRPWLEKCDSDFLRKESQPLYQTREGFTAIY